LSQPITKTGLGEPTIWWVGFSREAATWWANYIPGHFKHVKAAGYHPGADAIVFYDFGIERTMIAIGLGDAGFNSMVQWLDNCDVVTYRPQKCRPPALPLRFGLWCVPAIKHLLGIRSGALRPDALMRDLLQNGATVFAPTEPEPHEDLAAAAAEQR
jgi:hypothetical protein